MVGAVSHWGDSIGGGSGLADAHRLHGVGCTCLCFTLLLTAGCITHAFAPPLRGVAIESPAVLATRETAIAGEGSLGFGSQEFGQATVTVRMRRGLTRRLEGSLEANAFHYSQVQTTAATLRAGVKVCALLAPAGCALAVTAGTGAGAYDHAALFGGDVGAILGWENTWLVPFVGTRIGIGMPVAPRAVYDGDSCYSYPVRDRPQPCGAVFNTPKADLILTLTAGLRFPLPLLHEPRVALLGAYAATWMFDGDADQIVHALGWGAEISF